MSQHCRPERNTRARQTQAAFERDDRVVEATIVPPAQDPTDRFVVDVLLDETVAGFPSDLAESLPFSVVVRDVRPQGPYWIAHCLV